MTISVRTLGGAELPWPHSYPPRLGDQIVSVKLGLLVVCQVRWVAETGFCDVRVAPVGAMFEHQARAV